MVARLLLPEWDERYRGYGRNKIAHVWWLAQLGFRFEVRPRASAASSRASSSILPAAAAASAPTSASHSAF